LSTAGIAQSSLITLTADITSAYVGNNRVAAADLAGLIETIYRALAGTEAPADTIVAPKMPVVPIKKSITYDYLICLEDGRRFKSLKRHLRTKYNLSPDEYRAKWNLPTDYPMVAPAYSATRSGLAKSMGLGQGGRPAEAATKPRPAAKQDATKAIPTA